MSSRCRKINWRFIKMDESHPTLLNTYKGTGHSFGREKLPSRDDRSTQSAPGSEPALMVHIGHAACAHSPPSLRDIDPPSPPRLRTGPVRGQRSGVMALATRTEFRRWRTRRAVKSAAIEENPTCVG